MLKHRNITIERLEKFISTSYFQDVNLISKLWKQRISEPISFQVFSVPDLKRITFDEAVKQKFVPAKVGDSFGPSWSTHWFHLTFKIPENLQGETVYLVFDSNSEALLWSTDGVPLQGFTGGKGGDRNVEYLLTSNSKGNQEFEFYVEMAANGMFGVGDGINAPDPNRTFKLEEVGLAVPNLEVFDLFHDFEVILGIAKSAPTDSQIAADALYTANEIVNKFHPETSSSWVECLKTSKVFLQQKSSDYTHFISAIGHCHIDTAWLWPYDETKRKCARSWSTQIELMNQYPDHKFAASQAQQFYWVKNLYPKLYEKIQEKYRQGQFIPIGGTWVEMDCNIPSGEAFCRQFLYGQRFFEKEFGKRSQVFWLPDTFGYFAQLPQIVKESDLKYFFTQKLSWNNINKFPNHTFYWAGLDETKILVHFSPTDTYNAQCTANELLFTVKNNKDKEYSNKSLMLYGNGDGGGGPIRSMLERLNRMKHLPGLPVTNIENPNIFFRELETTSRDLVEWKGELYFELHRGTYTSQAATKRFNRKSEILLQNVEKLGVFASLLNDKYKFDKNLIDELWRDLLLNQFHDVLPGSSIGLVYIDALKLYENIMKQGAKLSLEAFKHIVHHDEKNQASALAVINTNGHDRKLDIIEIDAEKISSQGLQMDYSGTKKLYVIENLSEYSIKYHNLEYDIMESPITIINENHQFIVENKFILVKFNDHLQITSIYDKLEKREIIKKGDLANNFVYFEDIPLFWDAWDVEVYHLQKKWNAQVGKAKIIENGPLRICLEVNHPISLTSKLNLKIFISAISPLITFECEVDWNENRKILKVEFPVDIMNDVATYETAFGILNRPTHFNTSWDMAKFEVCGHKFMDLSEFDYGVSLLNDSKYGYSCHKNVMRISLIRSPKAPDDKCDIGKHVFKYGLLPHSGNFYQSETISEASFFNNPLMVLPANGNNSIQFFKVDKKNLILDSVKFMENDNSKIILRLYESLGGRGIANIISYWKIEKAFTCNILEDEKEVIEIQGNEKSSFQLNFTPYKIITVKLELKV